MAYFHVNSNASTQVQKGTTRLSKVIVGTTGSAWTITIYDGTGTSSPEVANITASDGGNYDFDLTLTEGLYIVTAGTTPGDATIVFD